MTRQMFAARIKAGIQALMIRGERGVRTPIDLIGASGLSQAMVYAFLKGEKNGNYNTWEKLSMAFGRDVEYVYDLGKRVL